MPRLTHLALILLMATSLTQARGQGVNVDDSSEVIRSRLATCLVRFAREVLGTEPLTVQGLASGTSLLVEATRLDPDLESAWRLLLDAAILTEQDELVEQALTAIVTLSPESTTARLQRLWKAIEGAHRLEHKSRLIDQLMDPANRSVVGSAAASRLAQRAALLHRQAGDEALFHRYLTDARTIDPANQEAASLYVGLQQHLLQVDPPKWTEELLSLYRMNPTDSRTASELGMLLLHHGAYEAAARMLGIARDLEREFGRDAGSEFDADYLLALWASDQMQAADDLILERHQRLNVMYRQIANEDGGRKSTLELTALVAPLPPKLAALESIIASEADDELARSDALGEAERAASDLDRLREADGVEPGPRAENLKRLLWLLVVLDGPGGSIEDVAHQIEVLAPLDPQEQAILEVATSPDMPIEQVEASLGTAAQSSSVASLVLASRLEGAGLQQSAAKVLLAAWERSPGSMLGVLAGKRLSTLLGVALPMSPDAHAMSAVISDLPSRFDRFAGEPSLGVTLRLTPRSVVVSPFDPVILDFELANHTADPLEIAANGPIRDLLLVQPSISVPYASTPSGPPVFLDLGRSLVLDAHGEVNLSLDLRTTWVGSVLDAKPLHGAVVDAVAFLNPRVATSPTSFAPVPMPGPLGSEVESREIRIDGVRTNAAWVDASLMALREAPSSMDVETIVLLTVIVSQRDASEGGTDISSEQSNRVAAAVSEAWPRLSVVSQAWLAAVMPRSDALRSVWSLVEGSTESLIQRIHLMRIVSDFDQPGRALGEPAVVSGLRSGDPDVRLLAEWIEATLQLQAEDRFGDQPDADTSP